MVKAGAERGIFGQTSINEVFCGADGTPVLNGAMGVDKMKVVDGIEKVLLGPPGQADPSPATPSKASLSQAKQRNAKQNNAK